LFESLRRFIKKRDARTWYYYYSLPLTELVVLPTVCKAYMTTAKRDLERKEIERKKSFPAKTKQTCSRQSDTERIFAIRRRITPDVANNDYCLRRAARKRCIVYKTADWFTKRNVDEWIYQNACRRGVLSRELWRRRLSA